jgi:hypothetical protein
MNYYARLQKTISAPADVLAAVEIAAELAADDGAIQEMVREYLCSFADSESRGPRQASGNFMSLIPDALAKKSGDLFSLGLSLHETGIAESIANLTAFTLVSPLNGPVSIDRFQIAGDWQIDTFDPSIHLVHVEQTTCNAKEVVSLAPGTNAYAFNFSSTIVCLKVQSQPVIPFEWSFDANTLKAWQLTSSMQVDTKAEHSCIRARAVRDSRAAPELAALTRHPRHFVRWAAAQALGQISPEMGVQALQALTGDMHPHVSRAASNALSRIGREP